MFGCGEGEGRRGILHQEPTIVIALDALVFCLVSGLTDIINGKPFKRQAAQTLATENNLRWGTILSWQFGILLGTLCGRNKDDCKHSFIHSDSFCTRDTVGNPAAFTQTVFFLSCRILWCYRCVTLKLVTNVVIRATKGFKLQCNNFARQVDEKCYLYFWTFNNNLTNISKPTTSPSLWS